MEPLPFDPSRMARRQSGPTAPKDDAPLTVTGLASLIARAIDDGLPAKVRVVGEIGGFRPGTHWYFTLRDDHAVINAVMWGSAARRSKLTPGDGQRVIATGRVEFYQPQGRVSFIADKIEPVGLGPLELRHRALLEEAKRLGWLDPARKRPLPSFPRRIAVITSRTGAALQDVLVTMRKRCPAVGVLTVDARVQGADAATQIARAVRMLSSRRHELGIDAVLITRGGGSAEDLHAFNERDVAEAIIRSDIPVVAAIGHETDITIAELVADQRCATPTQAAMLLTPDGAALLLQTDALARRLVNDTRRRLELERQRILAAGRVPLFRDPRAVLADRRAAVLRSAALLRASAGRSTAAAAQRLSRAAASLETHRPAEAYARRRAALASTRERLARAMHASLTAQPLHPLAERLARLQHATLASRAARLDATGRTLHAIGPGAVLARGYSCTFDARGRIVRSAAGIRAGQRLRTRVSDGEFHSLVEGAPAPPPGRPAPGAPPDQMDLFDKGG